MTLLGWVIVVAYFGAMAWALQAILRGNEAWASRTAKSLMVTALFSVLPAWYVHESLARKLEEKVQRKTYETAVAHFKDRCAKNAGERIFEVAKGVEGIFLRNPRTRPRESDLRSQFWTEDLYGLVLYPPVELVWYLTHLRPDSYTTTKPTDRRGFSYVEAPGPRPGEYFRYILRQGRDEIDQAISTERLSRYSIRREDISTREDRMHWVAGGRLTIVDDKADRILAERIGYVFEPGFGSINGGRRPWLIAQNRACPPIGRNLPIDRLFVERALSPS